MNNPPKAIALYSGGLDSMLSVLWMKKLGYEVIPVFFRSYFFTEHKAKALAGQIGLQLKVVDIGEELLTVLKKPRYGFGKYVNPCIDCHSLMFRTAGSLMTELQADFLISGEVLAQRPMSQRYDAMNAVAKYSGYRDYIIRPLSQKLLPDTLPIIEGWVNKDDMLDIQGRSRKRQMGLADEFGIKEYQTPGGGCYLTQKMYSYRLTDLMNHNQLEESHIRYLPYGRHFRISPRMKLIVGRDQTDNEQLQRLIKNELTMKVNRVEGPLGIINTDCSSLSDLSSDSDSLASELYLAASIFLSFANNANEIDDVRLIYPDSRIEVINAAKMKSDLIKQYWITPKT